MWFISMVRSLKSDSMRGRAGRRARSVIHSRPSNCRPQLEVLENRCLPSGFGSVGYVTTSLSANGDVAYSVVIQPDGKILAAGVSDNNLVSGQFGLVRYNSDGTLDTSFDGTGIVLTSFNSNAAFGHALALQTDGKIIEAGNFIANFRTRDYDAALARFNADGTLDTTFG